MVKALDMKLLRDLSRMKGQLVTIALVVAVGIAIYVTLTGNYDSLQAARTAYYERYRFADVFAHVERAPQSLMGEVEGIDGVARAESRVMEGAMIPLETMSVPARAQLFSVPEGGQPQLNALHMRKGRWVEPGRSDEAILLESFAQAHDIEPGDELPAVINGRLRHLRVVGLALAPEHIMVLAPGDLAPDPARLAVIWMGRQALEAAYQMKGAFNDLTLRLQPGVDDRAVIARLDRVLEPYGGVGAISRAKQPSNFMLEGELVQLEGMSTTVPIIFLAVAALLLNIVLSRLVHLQRSEIAALKALGYGDLAIGVHFLKLVLVITLLGAGAGMLLGVWMGDAMTTLYGQYFKFPNLAFNFDLKAGATAVGISFVAALTGAFGAVLKVIQLPPAEAMRPAAPAKYRRSIVDRLGLGRVFGAGANMVIRELERRPLRAVMSSFAIAASVGLMVIGAWYGVALDEMAETIFSRAMQEDVSVTFVKPLPARAIRELEHIPGVMSAEGLRTVPVRFRAGHRHRDGAITGYMPPPAMRSLRNRMGDEVPLPPNGVVLTDILAEVLDVQVGDTIAVDVHEGDRKTRELVVSGLVDESFGLQGHMRIGALRSWLGEDEVVTMGLLRTDALQREVVNARLKDLPHVLGVVERRALIDRFYEQSGGMIVTMAIIMFLFGGTITVGVVYNNARVALSMRARDLASLRVLGFHRTEISAILLGEQAIQVLFALPFGLYLGKLMILAMASTVDPETFRLPVILTPQSYALAAVVALAAAAVSALLVRRKLDKLDLIAVLKTRE